MNGLIAVSCIDLLVAYGLHPTQRKLELECWNIYSYDWNVQLVKVSGCVEVQQMGGEPQGGETLAKPLIAPLDQ